MKATTVIFDIDGSLVDSSSFDGQLYIAAIRDVLGDVSMRADLHEYPNHTDTGILMEICKENGLSTVVTMRSVRQRFGKLVADYLSGGGKCSPIPGGRRNDLPALSPTGSPMVRNHHGLGCWSESDRRLKPESFTPGG